MLRMEKLSVLAMAGIGGLLGGSLATCFLSGGSALASNEKVIAAQRIEVVFSYLSSSTDLRVCS